MKTIEQAQNVAQANDKRIVRFGKASDGVNLLSSGYDANGFAVCNIYKSFDERFNPILLVRYTAQD